MRVLDCKFVLQYYIATTTIYDYNVLIYLTDPEAVFNKP